MQMNRLLEELMGGGGPMASTPQAALAAVAQQSAPAGTDWGALLDWGYGGSVAPLTSSWRDIPDTANIASGNLAFTPQNEQLLRSLGYTGSTSGGDGWDQAARQWLTDNGYTMGVGHASGTSTSLMQGRPEYWGLMGPDGKYVQGQSDPTKTAGDSWFDQIAPFALLAPAVGGIVSAAGSGALGASGAGLGGAGADLGSAALGAEAGGGGAVGSGLAAGESVAPLGASWSPEALGLTGGAGLETLPAVSVTGTSAGAGLGGLGGIGAAGSAAGGLAALNPSDAKLYQQGGPAPLGNMGGGAAVLPSVSTGGSILDSLGSVGGLIKDAAGAVGGAGNLAGIIGGIAGATSGGGNTTATQQSQIDPRMAQYLYGTGYGDTNSLLGAAQQYYQQNKSGLNDTMQQGLDMQRAALQDPAYGQAYTQMRNVGTGLLSAPMAGNPFTSQQPTMQAGGSGGLLGGGNYADRAKALMTSGRGLLG